MRRTSPAVGHLQKFLPLLAVALAGGLLMPCASEAQATRSVRGVVTDSVTGLPLDGVIVREAAGGVTATDEGGLFLLENVPDGIRVFGFSALGYGEVEISVDPPRGEVWHVRLEPRPLGLEGLTVEARRFRTRLDSVETFLDQSINRIRDARTPKVANSERLRRFDGVDDHAFRMAATLGVHPLLNHECGVRYFGAKLTPRIFIDGKELGWIGCDRFAAMDPKLVCRIELVPQWGKPALLRVFTCLFLARVASGEESIPKLMEVLIPDWWVVR